MIELTTNGRLYAGYYGGLTIRQCAADVGLSSTATYKRLKKMGVKFRPKQAPDKGKRALAKELRRMGNSYRAIGERIGICKSAAYRHVNG